MNDEEHVPEYAARIVGHICGVLFVILTASTLWVIIHAYPTTHPGAISLTLILLGLSWFFGTTARKLCSSPHKPIFTRVGYGVLALLASLLSILLGASAVIAYGAEHSNIPQALFMAAGALGCGAFAYRIGPKALKRPGRK